MDQEWKKECIILGHLCPSGILEFHPSIIGYDHPTWVWHTTQLDFVLAFPQAPVEQVIYMSIPEGFEVENG
jgi:hypothetical protein